MAIVPRSQVRLPSPTDDFVGDKQPKSKRNGSTFGVAHQRKHAAIALAAMKSGDWSEASASTFVAAFEAEHERVYGHAPVLTREDRRRATFAAARLLEQECGDDLGRLADFVRWVWKREVEREQYRRAHKSAGGIVNWHTQFNPKLFLDYRIQCARTS